VQRHQCSKQIVKQAVAQYDIDEAEHRRVSANSERKRETAICEAGEA
jgi:hypothetical protein